MKKILVLLHIFYTDQIAYFLGKLNNIQGAEWDLVVSGNNLDEQTLSVLKAFKPDMKYIPTPNVGYDIWPFIYCLRQTNLNDYDLVIKLHTKNIDNSAVIHFNGLKFSGTMWRDTMVNSMLGSANNFQKLCEKFDNPRTGICYSMDVDVKACGSYFEDGPMLEKEIKRLGIKAQDMHYCAGTMFAVRAQALNFLYDERICESIFPTYVKSHSSGSMAHVYERIFTIGVTAQGYKRATIPSSRRRKMYITFMRILKPIMTWFFELNYICEENSRLKYLRIFGIKIPLKRQYP